MASTAATSMADGRGAATTTTAAAATDAPAGRAPVAPASGLGVTVYTDRPVGRAEKDEHVAAAAKASAALPAVTIRGVRLHAVTEAQVVAHVMAELGAGRGGWVVTPNVDHLRRLRRDREFAALYERADLVVADGMPLIWASRLQRTPLPERVAGSSLISSLSAAAGAVGRSVYLLGGDEGTAEAAATVLRQRHRGLRIAGTCCPERGFERDPARLGQIGDALVAADPDIVFVALGSPKQEWLIGQLRDRLPRAWWLGIGISFSFLCGRVKRAPGWMQALGLEWLHRLGQEPKRLAKRYLVEGLPFATRMLVGSAFRGVAGRRPG